MEPVAQFNKQRWFTPTFIASHPGVVDKAMTMILSTSTRGYIGCARALQTLDYKRHLGRIECPTLFICGAQDVATSPSVMQEMAGLVPRAVIKIVDPGAHICNMENPEAFNAILGEWLTAALA
jgi:3-oxoadipate enol-lactonase